MSLEEDSCHHVSIFSFYSYIIKKKRFSEPRAVPDLYLYQTSLHSLNKFQMQCCTSSATVYTLLLMTSVRASNCLISNYFLLSLITPSLRFHRITTSSLFEFRSTTKYDSEDGVLKCNTLRFLCMARKRSEIHQ